MLMDWEIGVVRWANSWVGISEFIDWSIVFRAVYLWHLMAFAVLLFLAAAFLPRFERVKTKNIRLFFHAFLGALIARFVITEIIRFFWLRPRPFEILDDLNLLMNHASGGSFPSGHASLAFAVATAVYYYYPKTSILFFIAAANVGLARIALGLHWPTDILGGAAVGIFSAWLINALIRKFHNPP